MKPHFPLQAVPHLLLSQLQFPVLEVVNGGDNRLDFSRPPSSNSVKWNVARREHFS